MTLVLQEMLVYLKNELTKDGPGVFQFFADEFLLEKYALQIEHEDIPKDKNFNDFTKEYLIRLQSDVDNFKIHNSNYIKVRDDFTSFEEYLNSLEPKPSNPNNLIDLYYFFQRRVFQFEIDHKQDLVDKYTPSSQEIEGLVDKYVESKLTPFHKAYDALQNIGSHPYNTYRAQFTREARGEKLSELIKEYKKVYAEEIYQNILDRVIIPNIEKQYLDRIKSITTDTILVANLTNLEIGAKFQDASPSSEYINPRINMFGHNYQSVTSGYSLKNLNLSGTIIKNSRFREVDLSGINLRDTSMENVRFDDCKLTGADLRGADTGRTSINFLVRRDLILPESITEEEYVIHNLGDIKVSSHTFYVHNRKFLEKDLETGYTTMANIRPANTLLDGSSTREFNIGDEYMQSFTCDPVYKRGSNDALQVEYQASIKDLEKFIASEKSSLSYSFSDYINELYGEQNKKLYPSLTDISFTNEGLDLKGLNLSYTNFYNSSFSMLDLKGTLFHGANLEGVNFEKCDLEYAELVNANCCFASFNNATLRNSNFTRVFADFASFNNAIFSLAAESSEQVDFESGDFSSCVARYVTANNMIANGLIATDGDLEGLSAIRSQMIRSNFRGTNLSRAVLNLTDMTCSELSDAIADNIIGFKTKLENAALSNIKARNANLKQAVLRNITAQNADLEKAVLSQANLEGALLENAILKSVEAVEANFSAAIIKNANLKFANLEKAILTSVDASNTDLRAASLKSIQAEKAKFIGANLEGANAEFANFKEAELTKIRASWANFTKANLRGAKLCKAVLLAAKLHKAQVSTIASTQTDDTPPTENGTPATDFTEAAVDEFTDLTGIENLGDTIGGKDLNKQKVIQETSIISQLINYIFEGFIKTFRNITIESASLLICCSIFGITISPNVLALSIAGPVLFEVGKLIAGPIGDAIIKISELYNDLNADKIRELGISAAKSIMHNFSSAIGNTLIDLERKPLDEFAIENLTALAQQFEAVLLDNFKTPKDFEVTLENTTGQTLDSKKNEPSTANSEKANSENRSDLKREIAREINVVVSCQKFAKMILTSRKKEELALS
jgi:uncharacterized protein YjbI with pentapeptide repeats